MIEVPFPGPPAHSGLIFHPILPQIPLKVAPRLHARAGRSFPLEGRAFIDPMKIFYHYEPRNLAAAVRKYLGREHDGGHSAEADVLGKTDFDFHPRDLAAQYAASDQAILESGESLLNLEEPGINPATGETICLLSSKIPLRDNRGKITGIVGVKRDISESKAI